MPYANNQGTNIYYEVEGQGQPIILAHGLTGNITFWTSFGYVDMLKDKYSVILFDARGHGKSDKPHEAESYDHQLMVGDVIAVMDSVGVPRAHYWGFSMGGLTGLGMAKHFPQRLLSLVLGGTAPGAPSDKTDEPGPLLKIFRQGAEEGVDVVIENIKALAGSITPQYEERLQGLDLQAMASAMEYFQYQQPNQENDVLQLELLCLFYAGDADEEAHKFGKEMASKMTNVRYFSLPGLNHFGSGSATEQIVPQVLSFLAELEDRKENL